MCVRAKLGSAAVAGVALVALCEVINGDSDPRTPLPGVRESTDAAESVYRAANAQERFQVVLQPNTGHTFTKPAEQQALDWLVKWLKP